MIFSSAPNDYLMHYGIKGQKWGIRRYQNPDGTLTEEGKARYSKGLNSVKKDSLFNSESRIRDAAIVGIKAMNNVYGFDEDYINKNNRDWFVYEDQTRGMPIIADLANMGYNSKEIQNIINVTYNTNPKYIPEDSRSFFDLRYFGRDLDPDKKQYADPKAKDYIDECVKIARNKEKITINDTVNKLYKEGNDIKAVSLDSMLETLIDEGGYEADKIPDNVVDSVEKALNKKGISIYD